MGSFLHLVESLSGRQRPSCRPRSGECVSSPLCVCVSLLRDQHLLGDYQQRQQCLGGGEPALWLQRALRHRAPKPPLRGLAPGGQAEPTQRNCASGSGGDPAARPLVRRAQQLWGHPGGAGPARLLHPGDLQQRQGGRGPLRVPGGRVDADAGWGVADGWGAAHWHPGVHHFSG